MILGLVVDGSGSPICTEMWPGNTADAEPCCCTRWIDQLGQRFGIGRVCIVADRGMISAETIAGLEQRKLDYILGARERSDALVRKIVLANEGPFVPLLIERQEAGRSATVCQRGEGRGQALHSSAETRRRPRKTARTVKRSSPPSMRN